MGTFYHWKKLISHRLTRENNVFWNAHNSRMSHQIWMKCDLNKIWFHSQAYRWLKKSLNPFQNLQEYTSFFTSKIFIRNLFPIISRMRTRLKDRDLHTLMYSHCIYMQIMIIFQNIILEVLRPFRKQEEIDPHYSQFKYNRSNLIISDYWKRK